MKNTQAPPIVLEAKSIHKTFHRPNPVPILQGIDLVVRQGDTIAIMGRSGEGKSTLLHILGTLETPCSGSLEIAGQHITQFNKSRIRNRKLAFVFQSFHLLEDYTALDNVLMPARIARQPSSYGSTAYRRACQCLDMVGLGHRKDFDAKLLSGGEKQRVAIARAFCNDPDIILADEPSGNLDRQTSSHIHQLLLDFANTHKKTLIVVTHNAELAALCRFRYSLRNGKLDSTLVMQEVY